MRYNWLTNFTIFKPIYNNYIFKHIPYKKHFFYKIIIEVEKYYVLQKQKNEYREYGSI